MNNTIIKKVIKYVKSNCDMKERWKYHLYPMSKYAMLLADKYKADKEVVILASWLHDITRTKGGVENHHITGAREAEKILKREGYARDKINQIKSCIYSHRGSIRIKRKTIEAEIVANADALSHFEFGIIFFYNAYGDNKMTIDKGAEKIIKKLKRSWNKISLPIARKIARDKYLAMENILSPFGVGSYNNYIKKLNKKLSKYN
jgi:uncharacterized protein